jgi:hypothetical protein
MEQLYNNIREIEYDVVHFRLLGILGPDMGSEIWIQRLRNRKQRQLKI